MKPTVLLLCALALGCEPPKDPDAGPCHDEAHEFSGFYKVTCHRDAAIKRDGAWWLCVCPRTGGDR